LTERLQESRIHLHHLQPLVHQILESEGVEFLLALLLPPGIGGDPQKLEIAHAGNFHRVLEAQEQADAGPLLGIKLQQISAAVGHRSTGDGVGGVTGKNLGEGALAAAVAPHHRMDLTGPQGQVDAVKNGLIRNAGAQIADIEQNGGVGADHGVGRGRKRSGCNGAWGFLSPPTPRA